MKGNGEITVTVNYQTGAIKLAAAPSFLVLSPIFFDHPFSRVLPVCVFDIHRVYIHKGNQVVGNISL